MSELAIPHVTLGRTGLRVSVAGLGCGGASRLGLRTGASRDECVGVVKAALELGIDFIDTAAAYDTEEIVGAAVSGVRESLVLSTKLPVVPRGASSRSRRIIRGATLIRGLEASLRRLGTDYVDILHLHGVLPHQYQRCADELVPAMLRLKEQGKIRFLGLTERFHRDPRHAMLVRALRDDCWDVLMAGFNLFNPSARERVFATAREGGVGTLVMFAVRRALNDRAVLDDTIAALVADGMIAAGRVDARKLREVLVEQGGATGLVDGAYRFCRHEPGVDVVLTGTGNPEHLRANVRSLRAAPLSPECLEVLRDLFGAIDSVSCN
jgi:L-galactose dehydrogenase